MSNYKIVCINLARRPDRRLQMVEKFFNAGITSYQFFDAVDGKKLDQTDPDVNFFKHGRTYVLQRGVIGCALSHYKIWKMLINDSQCDRYVVLEDDIRFSENFKMHLEDFLAGIGDRIFLYLGFSISQKNYQNTRDVYQHDTSYTIHPVNKSFYLGGLFGYVITKMAAVRLYNFIEKSGIRITIDDLVSLRTDFPLHETHPHIIFSDLVLAPNDGVDTDIQKDLVKIEFKPLENNYLFNDYLFFPNRDFFGGDIRHAYADIPKLKKMADEMGECVAFNTYGWLKKKVSLEKFAVIENKYYSPDGLYIKKKYLATISNKPFNDNIFSDYYFYPNRDSPGRDLLRESGGVNDFRIMADAMDDCIAFNTSGFLKYQIVEKDSLVPMKNENYTPDGLYVKKSYDEDAFILQTKIQKLRELMESRPPNIFVNKHADLYAKRIVGMILGKFPSYHLVSDDRTFDIAINHVTDETLYHSKYSFNILISGEPWNTEPKFDLAIDTKFRSNARHTIYYPYLFSSLHEHKKSIDPKDYRKPKTKFCAYMYKKSFEHRIKYFKLLSTYKRVDALGQCCHNTEIENTRYQYDKDLTYLDCAVRYYSEYKFVLAIENSVVDGYATEKLINPLIANSLPIYGGDSKIFQFINKKRVVYIPDFPTDIELLDHIKLLDENTEAYDKIIAEPIYANPNLDMDKELNEQIGAIFN